MRLLATLLISSLVIIVNAQNCENPPWPSPAHDRMETLLYEGVTQGGFNLSTLVANCRLIRTFSTIAAEWVRLAFHDMATHNVDDGTGGIDYSIGFELDRPENVGSGIRNSLADYRPAASPYISMSDLIAMGVVMASVGCGGPMIPFRSGRIDSYVPGREGVPEPHQDLQTHVESFRKQGFTPKEMIQLLACGHTLGGVRNLDFPGIVPPRGESGSTGIVFFDGSHQNFDTTVVAQYLNGTTQNPLVVHANDTIRSDLRIFGSDGNQTIQEMASPETFSTTCALLLERMINTVPANVKLSEVMHPLRYKLEPLLWSVGNESLVMKTALRILNAPNNPARTVSLFWKEKSGTACTRETCSIQSQTSTSVWGMVLSKLGHTAMRYNFVASIDTASSMSEFWFEINENDGSEPIVVDNDGCGYTLSDTEDALFFDVGRSFVHDSPSETVIVIAAREDVSPDNISVETYTMVSQDTPLIETWEATLDTSIMPTLGYKFYAVHIPFRLGISGLGHFTIHGIVNGAPITSELHDRGIIEIIFDLRA